MSTAKGFTILALAFVLAANSNNALAQVSAASMNGTVRDATGAVVPGAAIVLKNVDTTVERRTRSNSAGNYAFLQVPPGNYTLQTSTAGFATQKSEAFTLVVNQTATFNFTLQVGNIEQAVTVQAVGAEVQASTAEIGAVIGEKRIMDLPLNGRNFTALLALTPGITPVSVAQNQAGPGTIIGAAIMPSVNGQNNRSNFYMLDGVNNQAAYVNAYAVGPIIDTLEEFKIQSHNDEAQFGGALGGIVNLVTKSGTNKVHGTLWEFVRNDAFDARNFFLPSVTPYKWNQFGVSAGGPVVIPKLYNGRNRTFFMLGYAGYRYRTPSNVYAIVPTAAQLQGDESASSKLFYDPFSTVLNPSTASGYSRLPFAGNMVPQGRIVSGMQTWAKAVFPTPVYTGNGAFNALNTTPSSRQEDEYTARLDQNLGRKNNVFFRYSGALNNAQSGGAVASLANVGENSAKNIAVSWVSAISPSTVLQVEFGRAIMHDKTLTRYQGVPADLAKQVGFASDWTGNWHGGGTLQAGMSFATYGGLYESDYITRPTNIWQWKADLSRVWRGHTFKIGGEFTKNDVRIDNHTALSTFDVTTTNDPNNPGGSGNEIASFLLNVPTSAQRRNLAVSTRFGGTTGAYFQDQWKATPRLTVNFGLRYDLTMYPGYGTASDGNLYIGTMDFLTGRYILQYKPPACAVTKVAPCIPTADGSLPDHVVVDPRGKLMHNSKDNWQPRVGLAYRIKQNTVFRASLGRFFDNWAGVYGQATNTQGSWPSVDFLTGSLNLLTPQTLTPTVTGTNPYPSGGTTPAATPWAIAANYFDPNLKNPQSMMWNAGFQHSFGPSTIVSLNYVGSHSTRLNIGTTYGVSLYPGSGNPSLRYPFPYMSPSTFDRSWGRSSYNALQLHYDRKFSSGFAYAVSYTYSKALDLGCSGWFQVEGCQVQDPYNFNNDKGPAGFDLTHVLAVNWVYELPFGPGKSLKTGNRAADYIIGNWQVNGIAQIHTGQPYTPTIRADIANTNNGGYRDPSGQRNGYERPNVVGDPTLTNPSPSMWFNTAALVQPALYTFGNLGRHRLRGDWTRNFDLSVFRQFRIRESTRAELRAEAFNAFNTPTFAVPVGDMLNPNYGRSLGTLTSPRQLQLGLKIVF